MDTPYPTLFSSASTEPHRALYQRFLSQCVPVGDRDPHDPSTWRFSVPALRTSLQRGAPQLRPLLEVVRAAGRTGGPGLSGGRQPTVYRFSAQGRVALADLLPAPLKAPLLPRLPVARVAPLRPQPLTPLTVATEATVAPSTGPESRPPAVPAAAGNVRKPRTGVAGQVGMYATDCARQALARFPLLAEPTPAPVVTATTARLRVAPIQQAARAPYAGRDAETERQCALHVNARMRPDGLLATTYRERTPGGRLYAIAPEGTPNYSAQGLEKGVRAAAFADYAQVDIQNSFGSILNAVVGGTLPTLRRSVEEREAWLASLQARYGCTWGAAKQATLAIMLGARAGGPTLKTHLGAGYGTCGCPPAPQLLALSEEMEYARNVLRAMAPELEGEARKIRARNAKHAWLTPQVALALDEDEHASSPGREARAYHARVKLTWAYLVLERIEQRAMRAVHVHLVARNLRPALLLHDGLYLPPGDISLEALDAVANAATGMSCFHFTLKPPTP